MGSLSQYCKTRQTFVATKHRLTVCILSAATARARNVRCEELSA